MTLGRRIQQYRKEKGLSQEALGEALGVSRQAVSKWEGDNGIPELDTLIAMSSLFGVTLGTLLGVEEPRTAPQTAPQAGQSAPDSAPRDGDREGETRTRRVLEEYVRQSRAGQEKQRRRLALPAGLLAGLLLLSLFRIGSLESDLRQLRSQLSLLEVRVDNSLSGISSQIQSSINAALEENQRFTSSFSWDVAAFDVERQTVTLELHATMKEYPAGGAAQFLASWEDGRQEADWCGGPDFTARLTLPMSSALQISLRLRDGEGNIREQTLDTIHDLHPDYFRLHADSLRAVFAFSVNLSWGSTSTALSEEPRVCITSFWPEQLWPTAADIALTVGGKQVYSGAMTLSGQADEHGDFFATLPEKYVQQLLAEGQAVEITLTVTDNLGRTDVFSQCGTVREGELELESESAPVAWQR